MRLTRTTTWKTCPSALPFGIILPEPGPEPDDEGLRARARGISEKEGVKPCCCCCCWLAGWLFVMRR